MVSGLDALEKRKLLQCQVMSLYSLSYPDSHRRDRKVIYDKGGKNMKVWKG
jgi:hypothetical protein